MSKTIDEKLAGTNPKEWAAATIAAYEENGTYARLQRYLDPATITDETSVRRALEMIRALGGFLNGPYTGSDLPVRLLTPSLALRKVPRLWKQYEDELFQNVLAFMSKQGMEATFRSAVLSDLNDDMVQRLFGAFASRFSERVPAVDEQLRGEGRMKGTTSETRHRIAVARDAMGLARRASVKALALKEGPGTDGGPLLVLPTEVVDVWEGTARPSRPIEARFRFGDPDAPATDYDRACDVSEKGAGVLSVGELHGLVLGHTGCSFHVAKEECVFVMEGHGEEAAEALAAVSGWTAVDNTLALPSGKLVLFDATAARAKTREKKTLSVVPGTYMISVFHRAKPWLWMVRLVLAGAAGAKRKTPTTAAKKSPAGSRRRLARLMSTSR